jgi:hypothetical protein
MWPSALLASALSEILTQGLSHGELVGTGGDVVLDAVEPTADILQLGVTAFVQAGPVTDGEDVVESKLGSDDQEKFHDDEVVGDAAGGIQKGLSGAVTGDEVSGDTVEVCEVGCFSVHDVLAWDRSQYDGGWCRNGGGSRTTHRGARHRSSGG